MGSNQLLLTFIFGLTSVCECTDPCGDYQLLDDETRYTDYTLPFGQTAQCDRSIVEGWYRFQGDRNIPTTAPQPGKCGTDAPIWLQGTYPDTDGDTDTLTACKVGFFENCSPSWTIDVKNCGLYNVFNLKAISSCEGRYCMGSAVPCPEGTTSDTGFAPCNEETFNLTLTGYVYPYAFIPTFDPYSRERMLMFRCEFWFYSNDVDVDSILYDVRWDIDDTEFAIKHNLNKSEIASKGILKSTEWRNAGKKMGFNLKCSIRGKMEVNGTSSKYVEGHTEYIGIATWSNSITISSGSYALVHLYPTVPIACIYNSSHACRLRLELFDFTEQFKGAPMYCNESILELTKPSLCGLELDGWRRGGYTPLNISVPANSAPNQDYTALVKLRSIGLSYDPLWEDYHLPPIKINVVNDNITDDYWGWYYGYCSSSMDPWIETFDWNWYGFNDEGEFVLFRHKTKPIEVHTIQHKFNASDDWTENCAVAVRAGKDVFIVYGCGRPTQWIIRRLNCEAGSEYLQVYYRWEEYEVHLPTGTIVYVHISMNRRLNVRVYLSRSDRGDQVEGLCGNWNGDWTDDFMDRSGRVLDNSTLFARSWRVPLAESLFVAKRRNETINLSYMYCACSDTTITNSGVSPNVDCSWQEIIPTCPPLYWDREPCQISRRSRSIDDLDDDNEIDVPEDIVVHKEHTEANNEWKNGWNESSANDACMTYFEESSAYQACLAIDNLNITGEIHTCVTNIRISGTREFISDSLDSIVTHCSVELRKNTTLSSENDNEGLTIYEKIGKSICPNDCKYNGVKTGDCVEGICSCFANFTGGDCSINMNSPPILSGVSKESICDASKRACIQVSLYGSGYFPSDTLACRIRTGKITDTHYESISAHYTTTAAYKNKGEVKCTLMSSARRRKRSTLSSSNTTLYLVSITSNGIDFSSEVPVVIYDSDCTNCDITGSLVSCQHKEDVCIVDDNCFPSGSSLCASEEDNTSSQKLWIIGVVAGIVIAFFLGVLVMKCYTKKRFSVFPIQVCGGRDESVYETNDEFMYDKQHSAMEFATAPASTTN